jgi:hypothetical protein
MILAPQCAVGDGREFVPRVAGGTKAQAEFAIDCPCPKVSMTIAAAREPVNGKTPPNRKLDVFY